MEPPRGTWFPRLVGALSALMAAYYAAWCALSPLAAGDQVAFGHRLTADAGWAATALHAAFFAWLAYACFARRSTAVWGLVGYCVYLIESVWVYTTGEGRELFPSAMTMVIVNGVLTALLLTFARIALQRRAAFDR